MTNPPLPLGQPAHSAGPFQSAVVTRGLVVLIVDDEAPALADLAFELRACDGVIEVVEASDAGSALRLMRQRPVDAVFLDVRMPGLDGLELARVLQQLKVPPPIVFVTAFETHAVEAFDVDAIDFLLKPVRRERVERALERIRAAIASEDQPSGMKRESVRRGEGTSTLVSGSVLPTDPTKSVQNRPQDGERADAEPRSATAAQVVELRPDAGTLNRSDSTISVESAGRIRFIDREDVLFVASSGDYVRLHTSDSSYLFRASLAALEERWSGFGFVRIHRSYLVAIPHIEEVRVETGKGLVVRIGGRALPVSRRLSANLRQRLFDYAASRPRR